MRETHVKLQPVSPPFVFVFICFMIVFVKLA